MKQMDFHLVHNQKENCHHDHIPINLKGNENIFFWVSGLIKKNNNKQGKNRTAGSVYSFNLWTAAARRYEARGTNFKMNTGQKILPITSSKL